MKGNWSGREHRQYGWLQPAVLFSTSPALLAAATPGFSIVKRVQKPQSRRPRDTCLHCGMFFGAARPFNKSYPSAVSVKEKCLIGQRKAEHVPTGSGPGSLPQAVRRAHEWARRRRTGSRMLDRINGQAFKGTCAHPIPHFEFDVPALGRQANHWNILTTI